MELYTSLQANCGQNIFWLLIIVVAFGGFCAVTVTHVIRLVREPITTSITLTRENELGFQQ